MIRSIISKGGKREQQTQQKPVILASEHHPTSLLMDIDKATATSIFNAHAASNNILPSTICLTALTTPSLFSPLVDSPREPTRHLGPLSVRMRSDSPSSTRSRRSSLAVASPTFQATSASTSATHHTLKRSRFSVENLSLSLSTSSSVSFSDAPPISAADFEVLSTIGTGSFGRVLLARHLPTGEPVALKKLRKVDVLRNSELAHLLSERSAMCAVDRCPFLVAFKGSYQDEEYVYLVLEYCPGGELFTLCVSMGCLMERDAKMYAAEVILGLEALHDHDYVYRDLKPENVLIDSQGHIRLADYGFVHKLTPERSKCYTICGTPEYSAPEIVLNAGHSREVDWWALGILIFEMVAGYTPFAAPGGSHAMLFRNIVRGQFDRPVGITDECFDLLRRLLEQNPRRRLGHGGAAEVKGHPWFADVDWERVGMKAQPMPFVPSLSSPFDASHFHASDEDAPGLAVNDPAPLSPTEQLLFSAF